MSIEVSNFLNAQSAMPGLITILPEDGDGVRSGAYSSTALSLAKVLEREKIAFKFHTRPERLLEQRGAEWFGPALLLASNICEFYPDVVKRLLDAISAHVTQLYPAGSDPKVKMTFIINKSEGGTDAKIKFEGGVDSFSELLGTIEKVCASNGNE